MTHEELSKHVAEQAGKSCLAQHQTVASMAHEDRVKLLTDRGWKKYRDDDGEMDGVWTNDKEWGGISIEWATQIALRQVEAEKREKTKRISRICNKCGKQMCNELGVYGLVDAEVSGGYYSDPLSDTVTYRFSLCESCLWELFKSFGNPPEIESYL